MHGAVAKEKEGKQRLERTGQLLEDGSLIHNYTILHAAAFASNILLQ